MKNLRFSVVIPTRERHETLKHTLRTCLAQNFDSYEIIVCDNYSSSATKEVVDEFQSPRIKYIRSSEPLAMSLNWELAVSHTSGEYVIIIGDDDGLLFHALRDIDYLLDVLGVKVLRWERIYYEWPNVALADSRLAVLANKINIPLVRGSSLIKAHQVISKVANNLLDYQKLPMLYNSAIHRDLINLLREKTGRIFSASCPDLYSGFAFAYLAKNYASIGRPMSINGSSPKSNGLSTVVLKSKNSIAEEFHKLNKTVNLDFHSKIPNIPVLPAIIADNFQKTKDNLFPNEVSLSINRKQLIKKCVMALNAETKEEWNEKMLLIRDSLKDDLKLERWFNSQFLTLNPSPYLTNITINPFPKGFDGMNINLDGADFNIKNVFDVAEFYEKFTGHTYNRVEWTPVDLSILRKRVRSALRILIKGY